MFTLRKYDQIRNTQNLQHSLWDRESGFKERTTNESTALLYERNFYKSITPNLTIQNIDKPLGFMRKFTPDGRFLLSFSHDQRSLEVYVFKGIGAAADLLHGEIKECITAADGSIQSLRIRQQIFDRLFTLRSSIRLTPYSIVLCHLNREFSIFMDDIGRYVLVVAMGINVDPPVYDQVLRYPDICTECDIYAYTFFLVDIHVGIISDMFSYQEDFIMLSHNHGVSVHGNTIAILSKYRQCIDLRRFVDGKLQPLHTIGAFGLTIDEQPFSQIPECDDEFGELPLSHLKQHILAYLYRRIDDIESHEEKQKQLKEFYKNFSTYETMIMVKLQLIDEDHLLIRYENRPPHEVQLEPFRSDFNLYVFYCISLDQVLKVYSKHSVELLYLLRNFCDTFRNVRSLQTLRASSSPSNNIHFQAAFNSAITCVPGGQGEAAARFNLTLPISTQSFATTPYLDYNLFYYDDRLISALERPKLCSPNPIAFTDRNTHLVKFRLFLERSGRNDNNCCIGAPRELVTFIYHSFEPIIISIQRFSARYVVNIHIHNETTVVAQ